MLRFRRLRSHCSGAAGLSGPGRPSRRQRGEAGPLLGFLPGTSRQGPKCSRSPSSQELPALQSHIPHMARVSCTQTMLET